MDRDQFLPHLEYDLDIEAYHARPEISKSGLDTLSLSPAIYHARHLDPARPPREPKSGQLEGHLAHCAILEPETFDQRYATGPSVNRNTKVWKEFVESLPPGVTAIQEDQRDTALRQAESVRKIPDVAEALARGSAEVSAFWTDPVTGMRCRARPDFVHEVDESCVVLLDVKTYSLAAAHEFRLQCARKRYHVQDSLYSDGFAAASGKEVLAFIFVAVETEWPYAANALMLDDEAKEAGRALYRRDLSTYSQCLNTGVWPGYSAGIDLISLPAWAINQVEE